jgi:tRNA pseudouridine38-40 synthase
MVPGAPVRRLALLVEYEGTGFGGSQYQKNTGTIQDALERALSSLTGEPIRVALAGRTDAGVHARGQVAAFSTRSRHSPDVFLRALNHHLPDQIAVRAVREVRPDFDPRRRASARWYRYTVYNGRQRPALFRRFVWQVAEPLDVEAMRTAAEALLGEHDFAAFTQPSLAGRQSTRRRVVRAEVSRRGRRLTLDVEANAFLRRQVRRIAAVLVEVGRGKLSPKEFEAVLREARPGAASRTAPARGLCLMKVRYEDGLFDDETNEDI